MHILNIFRQLAANNEYKCSYGKGTGEWSAREVPTYFNWSGACTPQELIITLFNWLAVGVGVIVIVFVVVGAIQYITAAGNQEQAKKAIERIRNAVLALGLYMIMWALLNFLVPGGVFRNA
jgi:heme exporter protein D